MILREQYLQRQSYQPKVIKKKQEERENTYLSERRIHDGRAEVI